MEQQIKLAKQIGELNVMNQISDFILMELRLSPTEDVKDNLSRLNELLKKIRSEQN